VTVKPELAVAETVTGDSSKVVSGGRVKVIVWSALSTT
jgi:hypothetical protein